MAHVNTFIHGRTRHQVIAPCVVAELIDGRETYVYRNGILPAATRPAQVERLLEAGMIRTIDGSDS